MKLIQLNIRYDPEYPFDWVSEQDYYEAHYPPNRKPLFPFKWQSGVVIGPWAFYREHVVTGGFDPYAGERWTLEIGKWLEIELSTVVAFTGKLTVFGKTFESHEKCKKGKMHISWLWRVLLQALEYRYEWWARNEDVEDPYGSLGDYE